MLVINRPFIKLIRTLIAKKIPQHFCLHCLDICCRAGLVLHGLPHVLISVARGGSGSLLLGFGGKVSATLHVCLVVHDSVLVRSILVSNRVLGGLAIHILHESRRTVGYASLFHRIPARRSTYLCLLAGRSSLDSPAVVLNLPHLVLVWCRAKACASLRLLLVLLNRRGVHATAVTALLGVQLVDDWHCRAWISFVLLLRRQNDGIVLGIESLIPRLEVWATCPIHRGTPMLWPLHLCLLPLHPVSDKRVGKLYSWKDKKS